MLITIEVMHFGCSIVKKKLLQPLKEPLHLILILHLLIMAKVVHFAASTAKKKTTMAKLTRERKLRERRLEKQARKDARKQASAHQPDQPTDALPGDDRESVGPDAG